MATVRSVLRATTKFYYPNIMHMMLGFWNKQNICLRCGKVDCGILYNDLCSECRGAWKA